MIKLGFIGAGKVGTGLAASLNGKGKYQVVAVYDVISEATKAFVQTVKGCHIARSSQEVADMTEIVFITVIDSHIAPVCSQIKWRRGQSVLHVSGANSSELLESARKQGAHVGVFHPGFIFATAELAVKNLLEKTFDIEAEEPLLSTLKDIAATLRGQCVEVGPNERPVFHVADELASMYVILLLMIGTELMKAINIPKDKAMQALFPMLQATTNQIETIGIDRHFVGPVARCDLGTIRKHVDGLRKFAPGIVSLYRELALQSIPFVLRQGLINEQQAEEVKKLLNSVR